MLVGLTLQLLDLFILVVHVNPSAVGDLSEPVTFYMFRYYNRHICFFDNICYLQQASSNKERLNCGNNGIYLHVL